jgi:hypothetical protein
MGAAASAEMSADQLKEKYAEVKHRLYPNQQAEAEELMEKEASTAEIMEYVNKALNDPEVRCASKLNLLHHQQLTCISLLLHSDVSTWQLAVLQA